MVSPLAKLAFEGEAKAPQPLVPKPDPAAVKKPKTKVAVISSKTTRLRAKPSKRGKTLTRLSRKTKVEVLEYPELGM